ncbi:hypothetical protein UlMin_039274 [Ulmus minor]
MEGEEGEGLRLSKRIARGEVDYKPKSGLAWSHSYLNQKPWHPLSYPNQRHKWSAEQTHVNHDCRVQEVARKQQEFFRQTTLVSKKEKEKLEIMKAISFMYVRPPGYNAESAKAAEIADETNQDQTHDPSTTSMPMEPIPGKDQASGQKKKPRPQDVFRRSLPTEEEFEVLKNSPKMKTGVAGRAKPYGIELRNVRCLRCGNYGHQSGNHECPLKDAIMPNEENRLKTDDPLTTILARTDPTQALYNSNIFAVSIPTYQDLHFPLNINTKAMFQCCHKSAVEDESKGKDKDKDEGQNEVKYRGVRKRTWGSSRQKYMTLIGKELRYGWELST